MGGRRKGEQGPRDDGYTEDGYDESQRAEILETTRGGRGDGTILTDVTPDLGDDDEDEDGLTMIEGEAGEVDADAELTADDRDEDDIQADFDTGTPDGDDLGDADRDALEP